MTMNNKNTLKFWNIKSLIHVVGFLILMSTCCHGRVHQGTHHCEYYDRDECLNAGDCEPKVEDCGEMRDEDKGISFDKVDNYMLCYVSWFHTNSSVGPIIVKKGCWMNHERCNDVKECVENRPVASVFFCCCDGDMCNKEFHHRPKFLPEKTEKDIDEGGVVRKAGEYELSKTILCSIVPIIGLGFLVATFYFMWRRHRHHIGHHQLPTMDPNLIHTPSETPFSIQLIEHKAKGRFGYVWKAKLLDQYVAVKIFPLADKKSFSAEVDIYKQANMSHENILHFIGSEVKEENSYTEYYLITEYHERGSMYDYLKANTITWAQLCRIGETMTCGLAYLHDEIPATYNQALKPAIAHRDFKSKNVLIKTDLSACIADFGLALAFDPNLGVNETHTQVGTRRYMAPEVLEGAICFNMDSFLRIDMYACSLVIWELMTRCTCIEDVVDDYRLPFEAEVGLQPSLEEMQPLVAGQKRRPAIKPAWYQSPGMASLVTTMEECWDQDAEARLSAGCVHDRIAQLSRTMNSGGDNNNTTPQFLPSQHFIHHNHPVIPPPPSTPVVNCLPQSPLPAGPPPLYVPNTPPVIDPNGNTTNTLSSSLVSPRDLGSC